MVNVAVKNIGAIESLDIPLKAGQLTVMQGPNGSGKSTALKAVEAGSTGKRGDLTVRDGRMNGTISYGGCTLRLGARLTKRGEPAEPYVIIEDGAGIAELVDPGVKNPQAADKRRLKALLRGAEARLTDEVLSEFLGADLAGDFPLWLKNNKKRPADIIEDVECLKSFLHEQAREREDLVEQAKGRLVQIGDLPESVDEIPDVDAIRQKLNDVEQDLRMAKSRQEAQAEARQMLEGIEDPTKSIAGVDSDLAALEKSEESLTEEINDMRDKLEGLVRERATLYTDINRLKEKRESLERTETAYKAAKAKLDNMVTDEQVTKLGGECERLSKEYEDAVTAREKVRTLEQSRTEHREVSESLEKNQECASDLRAKAGNVTSLFEKALEGFEGWSLNEDMRLCVQHKRGEIPFAELSPGERAIRALDALLPLKHVEGVLPVAGIPQEVFEALDAENRSLLVNYLAERGIAGATAMASLSSGVDGIEVHAVVPAGA